MRTRPRTVRRGGVLVDKDGTLIVNVPFNVDPERIALLPGVASGLQRLTDAGFRFAVVSNQAGVALGRFSEDALRGVEARIAELLAPFDVHIAGYYWCTHAISAGCDCRKPQPGLLLAAAKACAFEITQSWMIGDILDDVEAGRRAGCRTILVDRGSETVWRLGPYREPHALVTRFDEAADIVLRDARRHPESRHEVQPS
jgi:D-glycero-D-manno-heptose 1,7-bisphosphate phosphatase